MTRSSASRRGHHRLSVRLRISDQHTPAGTPRHPDPARTNSFSRLRPLLKKTNSCIWFPRMRIWGTTTSRMILNRPKMKRSVKRRWVYCHRRRRWDGKWVYLEVPPGSPSHCKSQHATSTAGLNSSRWPIYCDHSVTSADVRLSVGQETFRLRNK